MDEISLKSQINIFNYRILLSEIGENITILEKYTPETKSRF